MNSEYLEWVDKVLFGDNAPHFLHLPTAPHHKHVGENDVIAANAPDLASVLMEIEGLIKA